MRDGQRFKRMMVYLRASSVPLKSKSPGSVLFSHVLAGAVSSALRRFTAVFGMGTGGAASLGPPGDNHFSSHSPERVIHSQSQAAAAVYLSRAHGVNEGEHSISPHLDPVAATEPPSQLHRSRAPRRGLPGRRVNDRYHLLNLVECRRGLPSIRLGRGCGATSGAARG